jgi:hypothetical protein
VFHFVLLDGHATFCIEAVGYKSCKKLIKLINLTTLSVAQII